MGKTILFMVRHGESEANKRDAYLGHYDLPLTEIGRKQAEMAADFAQTLGVDAIYTSDLSRARSTAFATARRLGLSVQAAPQMREMYMGQWEDMTFDRVRSDYAELFFIWANDIANGITPGGETVKELESRVLAAMTAIAERNPGKRVLVFCHGTPIRAMAAHGMGKAIGAIPWPSNASVTTLEYEAGKFTCTQYSRDDFMGEFVTRLPDNV